MEIVKEFWSSEEIARLFNVSTPTVSLWIRDNKFPGAIKPGGKYWRVPDADVQALKRAMYGGK